MPADRPMNYKWIAALFRWVELKWETNSVALYAAIMTFATVGFAGLYIHSNWLLGSEKDKRINREYQLSTSNQEQREWGQQFRDSSIMWQTRYGMLLQQYNQLKQYDTTKR